MFPLKGVFAKNEKECDKKALLILLILLLSVASIRRKLLKTTNTEEHSVHTNSETFNSDRKQINVISNKSLKY